MAPRSAREQGKSFYIALFGERVAQAPLSGAEQSNGKNGRGLNHTSREQMARTTIHTRLDFANTNLMIMTKMPRCVSSTLKSSPTHGLFCRGVSTRNVMLSQWGTTHTRSALNVSERSASIAAVNLDPNLVETLRPIEGIALLLAPAFAMGINLGRSV